MTPRLDGSYIEASLGNVKQSEGHYGPGLTLEPGVGYGFGGGGAYGGAYGSQGSVYTAGVGAGARGPTQYPYVDYGNSRDVWEY